MFGISGQHQAGEVASTSLAALDTQQNVMEEPHSYAHDTLGGIPQADVPNHQKLYVRYSNTPEGVHRQCRLGLLSVWAGTLPWIL